MVHEREAPDLLPQSDDDHISAERGPLPYERFEACICCVVWPTVATASGVLLYWLFLDNEQRTGWFSRAASMVFVAVLLAALACTIDVWSRLIRDVGRWLRAHQRLDPVP